MACIAVSLSASLLFLMPRVTRLLWASRVKGGHGLLVILMCFFFLSITRVEATDIVYVLVVCVCFSVCVCVFQCVVWCVCVCFHIIVVINCFGRTVLYVCIQYCIQVNIHHVSAQGIDGRVINVHYYCYKLPFSALRLPRGAGRPGCWKASSLPLITDELVWPSGKGVGW